MEKKYMNCLVKFNRLKDECYCFVVAGSIYYLNE